MITQNNANLEYQKLIASGAYDSATDGDDINQVTASWTNPETELDGVSVPNAAGTGLAGDMALSATPQQYGAGLLVLPNGVSGRSISIHYTIDGGSPLNKTVFLSQPLKWEMGKKYIYNLTINVNEILIALSISAHTSATAAYVLKHLPQLSGCDIHSTVMLPSADMEVLKKLGLNVTCEPKYQIKEIFIG